MPGFALWLLRFLAFSNPKHILRLMDTNERERTNANGGSTHTHMCLTYSLWVIWGAHSSRYGVGVSFTRMHQRAHRKRIKLLAQISVYSRKWNQRCFLVCRRKTVLLFSSFHRVSYRVEPEALNDDDIDPASRFTKINEPLCSSMQNALMLMRLFCRFHIKTGLMLHGLWGYLKL